MSLQQKQKYLRDNINPDQYGQFYQFCEDHIGNVDISNWTITHIQQIINKFNEYQVEAKKPKINQNQISLYDYQSSPNEQYSPPSNNILDQIYQTNSVQTSKVQKSAVDLLDHVFDDPSFNTKTQRKSPQPMKTSTVSFQEFNFWTNNYKQENPRQKSLSQFKANWSQPTHKKVQESPKETYFDITELYPKKKQSPYQKKSVPLELQTKQEVKKQHIKTQQNKPQQIVKANLNKWLVEDVGFKDRISCFKSTIRNNLSDSALNVVINDHDIVERSFLASNYAMYHMKVIPLGIECKRNYDDFYKLKDNLKKFFPGHHIPYLQPNSWFSATSIQFIKQQKKMLQFFIRDLIKDKEIKNSRIFEDFMTMKEHKTMKRKFQKYDELEKPKGIEELCLIEGKVDVAINKQQNNYKDALKHFINKMDDLLYRYQKLAESIEDQYHELTKTLSSLINLIGDLEKQTKNFNTKVNMNEIKYLGSVFRVLKESYKESLSNCKFEEELSKVKISPFIKYERSNILQMNNLTQINDRLTRSYEKRSQLEKIDPDEQYNSEKAKQVKKGIVEESKNLIVLKYQVGYFNKQVCEEGFRVFTEMGRKFLERWKKLGESYMDTTLKSLQYWKSLSKVEIVMS